jgi:hypothetical protein
MAAADVARVGAVPVAANLVQSAVAGTIADHASPPKQPLPFAKYTAQKASFHADSPAVLSADNVCDTSGL